MRVVLLISLVFLFSLAFGQSQSDDMAGMDMSHMSEHDQEKDMHDTSGMNNESDGNAAAMHSMEGHHMDMGPHMKMTTLRIRTTKLP